MMQSIEALSMQQQQVQLQQLQLPPQQQRRQPPPPQQQQQQQYGHATALLQNFSLPTAIPCSFAAKLHREYEAVRAESDPWIQSLAPEGAREMVLESLLPRYVCRIFPTVPSRRLGTVAKFIGWLTLADDVVDNMISGSASSWARSVLSVMLDDDISARNASSSSPPSSSSPSSSSQLYPAVCETVNPTPDVSLLLNALGELWADISCGISPRARAQFVAAMDHHFAAVCVHERLSSESTSMSMSVEEYMAIRRGSSGFFIGAKLLQYALGLDGDYDYDDPVDLHPLLADLQLLVVDYMCMCNDLVSCRAEIMKGDYFNLPSIVYNNNNHNHNNNNNNNNNHNHNNNNNNNNNHNHNHNNINSSSASFQDAIDAVVGMMGHVDARCVQLLDALHRDQRIVRLMQRDPRLAAYLDNMVSCMPGTLRWSFETVRYGLRPSTRSP